MTKRYEILLACSDVFYVESLVAQIQKNYLDRIIISVVSTWDGLQGLQEAGYCADMLITDRKFFELFMSSDEQNIEEAVAKLFHQISRSVGLLQGKHENASGEKISALERIFIPTYDLPKYSGAEQLVREVCRICGNLQDQDAVVGNIYKMSDNCQSREDLYLYVPALREEVSSRIDYSTSVTDETVKETTDIVLHEKAEDTSLFPQLSEQQKEWLSKAVFDSIKKLDILQPLLEDDSITEIMINGYHTIFIEKNTGITRLDRGFESEKRFSDIIQKMVSDVNKIINEFSPVVDLHLEDGSRVNIVLPPVALDGPVMTIRKFPNNRYSLDDLSKLELMSGETVEVLKDMVKARCNIFISGGTGSGKTTLLNALASEIPGEQRVVTIEDAAELDIQNVPNMVRLETRNANSEQKGAVRMDELIKTSLRMRPDRIIVGEVRGEEVFSMLQAMNTGHDGSFSTGHANSSYDMISRLEAMALMSADIPISSIRKQIVSAVDVLIHISRNESGVRKISEISEVVLQESGRNEGADIAINKLFELKDGKLVRTENEVSRTDKFRLYGLEDREWLVA